MHAHDDFGLATINTLEGLRAGAGSCDVTFNRTGHRCGNAAFEQVAVGVEYFFGYDTKLDLSKITEVSKLVSDLYEVPVPANAPDRRPQHVQLWRAAHPRHAARRLVPVGEHQGGKRRAVAGT